MNDVRSQANGLLTLNKCHSHTAALAGVITGAVTMVYYGVAQLLCPHDSDAVMHCCACLYGPEHQKYLGCVFRYFSATNTHATITRITCPRLTIPVALTLARSL